MAFSEKYIELRSIVKSEPWKKLKQKIFLLLVTTLYLYIMEIYIYIYIYYVYICK